MGFYGKIKKRKSSHCRSGSGKWFGSFEGVIKTKGELYEHLRYGGEHTIFIDRDNEHLNKISKGLTCITYGTEDEAELYVSGKAGICAPFLTFEWRHEDRRHKVSTHLIGSYNLKNALAAIAIGRFFNVSEEDISKALEEYIPHNNRSQLTPTADNNLIVRSNIAADFQKYFFNL